MSYVSHRSVLLFLFFAFLFDFQSFAQKTLDLGKLKGKTETLIEKKVKHSQIPLGAVSWNNINIDATPITTKKSVQFTIKEFPNMNWAGLPYSGKTIKLKNSKSTTRQGFKIPENSILNVRYLNVINGLPSNNYRDLTCDEDNTIWAVYNEGVVKLTGSSVTKITSVEGFPSADPTKICAFEGSIYIGTFGQGIIKITGDKLTHYRKKDGLVSDHIVDLEVFRGNLYVSTYDKGLSVMASGKQFQLQSSAFQKDQIIKHLHAGKDKLRAVTNVGEMLEFNNNAITVYSFPNFIANGFEQVGGNADAVAITTEADGLIFLSKGKAEVDVSNHLKKINRMMFTRSGNVWVSSNDAFCLYSAVKLVKKYDIDPLARNGVNAFFQDQQYNIWFASQVDGLGFIGISNFLIEKLDRIIDVDSKLNFKSKDAYTYFAHKDGGIVRSDVKGNYQEYKNLNLVDLNGMVEIGNTTFISSSSGLFKLENNILSKYVLVDYDGMNNHINLFKHNNNLYLNNYNYGLIRFENNEFHVIKNTSTLTYSGIVDKNNDIWIANYDKGVSKIVGNQITFYGKQEGALSDMVFQIAVNKENQLLVASSNGLMLIQDGKFDQFIVDRDVSIRYNNVVFEEKENKFWTSNSSEVIEIQKTKIDQSWKVTRHNQNEFIVSGQIKSNSLQINENRITFALNGNIVSHYPFRFSFQDKSFPLKITSFSIIDGKNLAWDSPERNKIAEYKSVINDIPKKLKLNPGAYTLRFNYGSNFWGSDNELRFYYRLVGLNNKWIGPLTETELVFHNLTSGEYVLEIKGENDKNIKFEPIKYTFEIKPYFYEYKSSIILFLLLTTALIYFSLRNFVNFNFKNLESYTSISSILLKVRIISVIGFVLFPFLTYYEGVQQKLHIPNWPATIFVMIVATLVFLFSFYRRITIAQANLLAYLSFSTVVTTEAVKCISAGSPPVLIIEFSCLLLFSGLIFQSGRKILIFNAYIFVLFAFLLKVYEVPSAALTLFISATAQVVFAVFSEYLIRLASTSKFSFSNKILENADLFVLVSDEQGKIIYVNNYTLKQLNKTESDLLGDGWWQMRGYKGEKLDSEIKEIRDMIFTGETKSAQSKVTVNGEKITIEWNNFILDGKFIIGVGKNVTEELLLKDQLLRLSSVATSVKNGVVFTTPEGIITWCNKSYEEISGFTLQELQGKRPSEFFKTPDFFQKELEQIMSKGPFLTEPVEIPHYDKKGNLFWLLIISSYVYNDDGSIKEIIEICSDITEQKALQDRYEYMVNNANDIIYTINIPGMFTYINPSFEKMLGFKPEDFLGKHYTTLIYEEDVKMVQKFYINQVMNATLQSYLEFRVLDSKGELHWLSQSVTLILNDGKIDQFSTIHAIVRDITTLKENQLQLSESENNFRMINETIEDVFWLYDRATSKMLYISPSCKNVFGIDQETWYNEPAKWRESILDLDKDVISNADEMFRQKINYEVDFRIIRDGKIRWIHEKIFMVTDETGISKVSGIASDVTTEKISSLELERLSLVAEKTNNAIVITNADGEIEYVNSAFTDLSGFDLTEIIGQKPGSFLQGPASDEKVIANIRRGLKRNSHIREEIINYTRAGVPYWIELVIDPVFDKNGNVTNYIAVSSNIEERKQKEKVILNQSQDITDSINYASRIQNAILPDIKNMNKIFKDVAVCYKPRDIIGGDFYWASERNGLTYFAVADCTGHGVSGAFLTLIGSRILEELVTNNAYTDPSEILQKLDDQLYMALNNKDTDILRDGMEIALCVIDSSKNILRYAGAGLGLLYIQKNETHYIKGQRKSIGDFRDDDFAFETKEIYFLGDEYFYLSTDGFQDQFGGENDKRYSKKRLISLLEDISHAYPEKRENILNSEINSYIGKTAQTDDITVIGFGLQSVQKLVNFGPIIQTHLLWKSRILDFLNGKQTLNHEQAVSHIQSDLGIWYYEEGKSLYGHITEMKQFEKENENLHNFVKDIMTYRALEDNDKAESLRIKLLKSSDKIVLLLKQSEEILNTEGNSSKEKINK